MAYNKSEIKVTERKYSASDNIDLSLFGAFSSDLTVRFEIEVPRRAACSGVFMEIHSDGLEGEVKKKRYELKWTRLKLDCDVFSADVEMSGAAMELSSESTGLYYYYYGVSLKDGARSFGGENVVELDEVNKAGERQILIYDENFSSSEKIKKGVIYHVFVDRFFRSGKCSVKRGAVFNPDWENGVPQFAEYPGASLPNNVFFGGDLYGIIEKLPYIASLGTSTIYLSPVFDAASNHKYDTGDFLKVDEMFGGDSALKELCEKASEYDIEIMLDGVFNHTGSDSSYFNKNGSYNSIGACQTKDSPYYNWYSFSNYPDKYESWWGIDILPRVDSSNPDYRDFICGKVVKKWMDAGVSSWRLDVADELSNEFLEDFRKAVKSFGDDCSVIGEVWEDASDKISYGMRRKYLRGAQLDSVMNYPLRDGVISYINHGDTSKLRFATEGLYRRYPKIASDSLMNFLGTHDTERALTLFGDGEFYGKSNAELSQRKLTRKKREEAKKKLMSAYTLIAGLPGTPCVFYGDEAGLEGYRDPFCRKPFPWNRIDEDLLSHYRKIGKIRKTEPLFRDGLFEIVELNENVFIYARKPRSNECKYYIMVVINRGDSDVTIETSSTCSELGGKKRAGKSFTISSMSGAYLKVDLDK